MVFCPLPFPAAAPNKSPHNVKKLKRRLVVCKRKQSHEAAPSVSREEESRLLHLADVALHKPEAPHSFLPAGIRAHRDHDRLINKLREAAQRSELDDVA